MSVKRASIAIILVFAAGFFSAPVFAAKSTTPTSFNSAKKLAPAIKKSTSNNDDGFFEKLDRQTQRDRRKNNRKNRKADNSKSMEESRTQETRQTDRKGRRDRLNRRERQLRAEKLTRSPDASSGGVNN